MKKLFTISILTLVLINAQGITNILGGNTSADKFVVENSNAETGLVVTGEGNVGMGTSSPLSKLHVFENINSSISLRLDNPNLGNAAATKIYFDGTNKAGISVFGPNFSGSENVIRFFNNRNSPDGSIDFIVSGGKKLVIDNTGNVGVNTASPGANLDVSGDMILGAEGTRFLEIKEVTGTTRGVDEYTTVNYPSGYNMTNTGGLIVRN